MAKFAKGALLDLLDGASDTLNEVSDKITGKTRWSINHSLVFREAASGKFFRVPYSVGATEQQDESPFGHDPDEIECAEVRPVEKTVTVYVPTDDA